MFVLHAPPEAFCEDIIHGSAFAVHVNLHLYGQEDGRVLGAGEMAALVMPNRGDAVVSARFAGVSTNGSSKVSESSQATTYREYQSIIATKYSHPWTSRMYGTSMPQT